MHTNNLVIPYRYLAVTMAITIQDEALDLAYKMEKFENRNHNIINVSLSGLPLLCCTRITGHTLTQQAS